MMTLCHTHTHTWPWADLSVSSPEMILCPMWLGIGHWRLSRLNHLLPAEYLRMVSRKVWGCLPSLFILVFKQMMKCSVWRIKCKDSVMWGAERPWPFHQAAQELLDLFFDVFSWWHFFEGVFIAERLKHEENANFNIKRENWYRECKSRVFDPLFEIKQLSNKVFLSPSGCHLIPVTSCPTWGAPVGVTGESSMPMARSFRRWALESPNSFTRSFKGKSWRSWMLTNPRDWSLLAVWWPTPMNRGQNRTKWLCWLCFVMNILFMLNHQLGTNKVDWTEFCFLLFFIYLPVDLFH